MVGLRKNQLLDFFSLKLLFLITKPGISTNQDSPTTFFLMVPFLFLIPWFLPWSGGLSRDSKRDMSPFSHNKLRCAWRSKTAWVKKDTSLNGIYSLLGKYMLNMPRYSMYRIFTYIYPLNYPNAGIYDHTLSNHMGMVFQMPWYLPTWFNHWKIKHWNGQLIFHMYLSWVG